MIFTPTQLRGAFVIEIEPREDERGFFARSFCEKEFAAHGLQPHFRQCNISFNIRKGTLRGFHFQRPPNEEAKLVRCTAGSIYDVIIDLRPDSPTVKQWQAFELSAENRLGLYIPEGFAHGFQTLVDRTEVFYQMSQFHSPESASGFRFDDPAFGISWPVQSPIVSDKDAGFAYYRE